jgi:hypothetical protein
MKPSYSVAPDGPSTKALAYTHTSPIESPSPPGPSFVKHRIQQYNAMDSNKTPKTPATPVPRLDLSEVQLKRKLVCSPVCHRLLLTHPLPQLTGSNKNPLTRPKPEEWLPVDEYITDHEVNKACRLFWDEKEYRLFIGSIPSKVVHFNSVHSIQVSGNTFCYRSSDLTPATIRTTWKVV